MFYSREGLHRHKLTHLGIHMLLADKHDIGPEIFCACLIADIRYAFSQLKYQLLFAV